MSDFGSERVGQPQTMQDGPRPTPSAFVRCPFCDHILPPGSVIGDGKEHATDAKEHVTGHVLSVGPDGIYRRCSCGLDFRTWAEADTHVKQAANDRRPNDGE